MNISTEMEYLSTCFFQGSDREYDDPVDWVKSRVVECLNDQQRNVVKSFLDELLRGPVTEKELATLWSSLDSDYWIGESGARMFFELIRAAAGSS